MPLPGEPAIVAEVAGLPAPACEIAPPDARIGWRTKYVQALY